MATSSYDSIFNLGTTKVIVAAGATVATWFDQIATQNQTILKYFSGGSLEIIGAPPGSTLTAAQLVTASGNHYVMGTTEILSLQGPIRCYLQALNATTIVHVIRGLSQST